MSSLLSHVSALGLSDLAIKSAAVMLVALIIVVLLRRASAAWRHLVWCLSVVSLLLLPALSLTLPNWRVSWLAQVAVLQPAERAPLAASHETAFPHEPVVPRPEAVIVEPSSATTALTESIESARTQTSPPAAPVEDAAPARGSISWLPIAWVTGGILSLVPLAVGLWQLSGLRRRSQLIDDPHWLSLLGELKRQLAVRRGVQLRQSVAAQMPVTWGALRPVLLLPTEASAWRVKRRRLVLLHELAHIRRWDWLTQMVAHVTCAVYWFNPLVWLAARQMRIERERACDDLVLASGVRASDFAEELLALAASLSGARLCTRFAVPMGSVPMIGRGGLEDRLRGILDKQRSRAAMTTAAVCLGAILAVAVAAPLAMLRAAAAESAEPDRVENKQEPPVKEKPTAEKSAEQPTEKAFTIRGKVVDDATGKPITQFAAQVGKLDPADPEKVTWGYREEPFNTPDGSFASMIRWGDGWIATLPVDVSKSDSNPPLRWPGSIHLADRWTARIVAEGYFPQPILVSGPPVGKDPIEVAVRLKRVPEKIRGTVVNHAGKPVKEARVYAVTIYGLNLAGGEARKLETGGAKDDTTRFVRTDERGRFELVTGDAQSLAVSSAELDVWPAEIPASGEIEIRLPQPGRVEIKLDVDGADKECTIFYELYTPELPAFRGLQSRRYVNIANPGSLVLDRLPPAKYQLCRQSARMLDRQVFELKPGETKSFNFVRAKGARVRGRITWPKDAKMTGAHVVVTSNDAAATIYASLQVGEDGKFLTERIPPGSQHLAAYAYKLSPEQAMMSGFILPSYHGQATIEVPAEGEVTVKDLALKSVRPPKPVEAAQPPVDKPAEKPANKAKEKPADKPAAQPTEQSAKSDQQRVVGNWFIMNEDSGRKGEMWVIYDDSILMYAKHSGRNSRRYAHRLDESKDPKQIDITVTHVNGSPVGVIKGLYALDGDELRLSLAELGKDRPAEFAKKPRPGELLILKRNPHGTWPPKEKEEPPAAKIDAPKIDSVKIVTVRGKAVDDATGEPISPVVLQGGKFEPADPTKVTWGYWELRSGARDGSFTTTVRWDEGWTARIVTQGYVPQPLLTSAPPADKDSVEVLIRLKRGPNVRGVVLDHAGKPVKDASVFAIGPTGLNLSAGQAWLSDGNANGEPKPARTDEKGRFELPIGGATSVAVSHEKFYAWPAAIPAGGDFTIRLPEPARVEINLDIDGAGKESVIFYQMLMHHLPEFRGLESSRYVKIDNPGKLVLDGLTPGRYQVCRRPGRMLEVQMFEIKPGEVKTIDYVRKTGARVRGKVTWPADAKLSSIVVSVVGTTNKSPFHNYEWNTVHASLAPSDDGTFLTERIAPGTYQLQAYAFKPLTPEQQRRTGATAPSYHAQFKIEVPAEGELLVKDLALTPIAPNK